jgi:GPH family glycoside/pentoside/hexuronide:cation symporter
MTNAARLLKQRNLVLVRASVADCSPLLLQSAAMPNGPAALPSAVEETAPTLIKRLSLSTKVSYGVGELSIAIRQSSVLHFLLFFYTNVMLLSPSLAGLALAVGRIWDGINNPVVGYLSDHTRTRWGRRRPYLLTSTPPLGVCFFLLWSPPEGLGTWGNFLFLAVAYMLMDTFFTLYATPYLALGAELSREYHERTQLVSIRAFFHGLGALLAITCLSRAVGSSAATLQEGTAVLPPTIAPDILRTGFAQVGALLGGMMVLSGCIAFYGSRELPPPGSTERVSWRAFLRKRERARSSQTPLTETPA